jgi:hypothetical protein
MEGARLPGTRRRKAIHLAETDGLLVATHYLQLAQSLANGA